MKVIFLGTPEFAVPTLQKLINSNHKVVAVVTQPDKPVGRNGKILYSPVKEIAIKNNIPVFQFNKIRVDGIEDLKKIDADIMVTCAYGQILSAEILNMKKFGVINVHGSLLPKYRGASPIQWAIINGETITGITILKSDVGIDDGKIILQKEVLIDENCTAKDLFEKLAPIGAECLIKALELIEGGNAKFIEQNHEIATVCKMFKEGSNLIDFNQEPIKIKNFIRGLNPNPVAYFMYKNKQFKVFTAEVVNNSVLLSKPFNEYVNGEVVVSKPKIGLIIKCENGFISILSIQAENSKVMDIKSFLNGKGFVEGSVLNYE